MHHSTRVVHSVGRLDGWEVIFLLRYRILQEQRTCQNLLNPHTKSRPMLIVHFNLGYVIVVSLTNVDVDVFGILVLYWFTKIKDEPPLVAGDQIKYKLFISVLVSIRSYLIQVITCHETEKLTEGNSNMFDSNT